MISPIKSNISFKGKVILGTVDHEADEAAGKKELSHLPKRAKGLIDEELNAFREELEAATPEGDIFLINFATDVRETGILARFSPPDGIATGLGMEVLYATPGAGKRKGELSIWTALSISQADFKSRKTKKDYNEQELKDNIKAAFDKLRKYTYLELAKVKARPEFQKETRIREIEAEIDAKEAQKQALQAEIDAKKEELQKIIDGK